MFFGFALSCIFFGTDFSTEISKLDCFKTQILILQPWMPEVLSECPSRRKRHSNLCYKISNFIHGSVKSYFTEAPDTHWVSIFNSSIILITIFFSWLLGTKHEFSITPEVMCSFFHALVLILVRIILNLC